MLSYGSMTQATTHGPHHVECRRTVRYVF